MKQQNTTTSQEQFDKANKIKLAEEKKYEAERKVQEEARKRIQTIAQSILDLFVKNDVIVSELPAINSIVDEKINTKVRGSSVKSLLK